MKEPPIGAFNRGEVRRNASNRDITGGFESQIRYGCQSVSYPYLRVGGISFREIVAHTGSNATVVIGVWNSWIEENQTSRKLVVVPRSMMSPCND